MIKKKENFKKRVLKPKKRIVKYVLPKDTHIDYKEVEVLKRYLTDRGKMLSRRLSGVTAQQQREIGIAIKRARFLGLLSVGSSKRR